MSNRRGLRTGGQVVVGVMLLAAGTAALLDNLGIIDIGGWLWSFWPLALVLYGVTKLFGERHIEDGSKGVWWIFIGLWLFLSLYPGFNLGFGDTWPLLLIAWGVSVMWKGFLQRSGERGGMIEDYTMRKENRNAS